MVMFPSLIQFHSEKEQGVDQKEKKNVKFGEEAVYVWKTVGPGKMLAIVGM